MQHVVPVLKSSTIETWVRDGRTYRDNWQNPPERGRRCTGIPREEARYSAGSSKQNTAGGGGDRPTTC